MDLKLNGKVVIVTGGSKGIGKAVSEAFAREGARVAVNARSEKELKETVDAITNAGGEAIGIAGDVTKPADVQRVVDETVKKWGTVHVLVNNAGGVGAFAPFEALSDDDWAQLFDFNVISAVRFSRAVLPYMKKQKWGRIIQISSESGSQPDAFMPHYNATKSAMNSLTKSLSKAYALDGILVNTVSPAFIMTPLVSEMLTKIGKEKGQTLDEAVEEFLTKNRPHIELKRPGTSEEVAGAVVFLASEEASFITGSNLRVDGGSVASI
jgi:NAD(P)-dependent dehydrogenase (short-subunit alcohol dehydrogenase family)